MIFLGLRSDEDEKLSKVLSSKNSFKKKKKEKNLISINVYKCI